MTTLKCPGVQQNLTVLYAAHTSRGVRAEVIRGRRGQWMKTDRRRPLPVALTGEATHSAMEMITLLTVTHEGS